MLFAEGNPDPASLGPFVQNLFWIIGSFCGLVVVACTVYATFFKNERRPSSSLVTRGELEKETGRLDLEIKETKTALTADIKEVKELTEGLIDRNEMLREITRLETGIKEGDRVLENSLRDLDRAFTEFRHAHSNKLHVMNLRVFYIQTVMAQIAEQVGVKPGPPPAIEAKDEA